MAIDFPIFINRCTIALTSSPIVRMLAISEG
jgi:hypothetical protein